MNKLILFFVALPVLTQAQPIKLSKVEVSISNAGAQNYTDPFFDESGQDQQSDALARVKDLETKKTYEMEVPFGLGETVIKDFIADKKNFYIDETGISKDLINDNEKWNSIREKLMKDKDTTAKEKSFLSKVVLGYDQLYHLKDLDKDSRQNLISKIEAAYIKYSPDIPLRKQPLGAYLNFIYQSKTANGSKDKTCQCMNFGGAEIKSCE